MPRNALRVSGNRALGERAGDAPANRPALGRMVVTVLRSLGPRPRLAEAAEGRVRLDLTDDFLVLTGLDGRFYLSLYLSPHLWGQKSGSSLPLNLPGWISPLPASFCPSTWSFFFFYLTPSLPPLSPPLLFFGEHFLKARVFAFM